MMNRRAVLACASASRMMSIVMPCDFDVHLDRGDAVDGTGDLEVHLAERSLRGPGCRMSTACFFPCRIRPIATPATCLRIGTPASISASVDPQTDAIDELPFDSSISLMTRSVYGNSSSRRQHRHERALGQVAVTDLAAARAAHRARLADRVRREVVVVHVALVGDRHDPVEALFVADRAEGCGGEHLRLPAREHAGSVDARHVVPLSTRSAGSRRACGRRDASSRRRP